MNPGCAHEASCTRPECQSDQEPRLRVGELRKCQHCGWPTHCSDDAGKADCLKCSRGRLAPSSCDGVLFVVEKRKQGNEWAPVSGTSSQNRSDVNALAALMNLDAGGGQLRFRVTRYERAQ